MSSYKRFSDLANKPSIKPLESVVIEIEDEEHKQSLIGSNKVCVVDVYGSWCGPCKVVAPKYEQLSKKYHNLGNCAMLKEDIDKGMSTEIQGVPTFLIYKEGNLVDTIIGANLDAVESKLGRIM